MERRGGSWPWPWMQMMMMNKCSRMRDKSSRASSAAAVIRNYGNGQITAQESCSSAAADARVEDEAVITAAMDAKDELIAQHVRVAEEAVSGWEKAHSESSDMKQKLAAAEERASTLETALNQCMSQLQLRLQQLMVVQNAEKQSEAEKMAMEKMLQERAMAANEATEAKNRAMAETENLRLQLAMAEKEQNKWAYELHLLRKEMAMKNEEIRCCRRATEASNKQYLEDLKKIAKLESECHRLRLRLRKKLVQSNRHGSAPNSVVPMAADHQINMSTTELAIDFVDDAAAAALVVVDGSSSVDDLRLRRQHNLELGLLAMAKENEALREALMICRRRNSELETAATKMGSRSEAEDGNYEVREAMAAESCRVAAAAGAAAEAAATPRLAAAEAAEAAATPRLAAATPRLAAAEAAATPRLAAAEAAATPTLASAAAEMKINDGDSESWAAALICELAQFGKKEKESSTPPTATIDSGCAASKPEDKMIISASSAAASSRRLQEEEGPMQAMSSAMTTVVELLESSISWHPPQFSAMDLCRPTSQFQSCVRSIIILCQTFLQQQQQHQDGAAATSVKLDAVDFLSEMASALDWLISYIFGSAASSAYGGSAPEYSQESSGVAEASRSSAGVRRNTTTTRNAASGGGAATAQLPQRHKAAEMQTNRILNLANDPFVNDSGETADDGDREAMATEGSGSKNSRRRESRQIWNEDQRCYSSMGLYEGESESNYDSNYGSPLRICRSRGMIRRRQAGASLSYGGQSDDSNYNSVVVFDALHRDRFALRSPAASPSSSTMFLSLKAWETPDTFWSPSPSPAAQKQSKGFSRFFFPKSKAKSTLNQIN